MKELLTIEKLKAMEPDTRFASGTVSDNENGVNMSRSDKLLRWVAVGGKWDWTIYIHFADYSMEYIAMSGDKVTGESNIRKLVPCTDEVFKKYRY